MATASRVSRSTLAIGSRWNLLIGILTDGDAPWALGKRREEVEMRGASARETGMYL
jgi:hypothetical protein